MKRLGIHFSILFVLLFTACSSDERHKIIGGELTVYFIDKQDEKLAEKVANYWKEHDLVTGKPQDLELSNVEGVHTLSMIANEPSHVEMMTFEEKRLLNDLEKDLWIEIFGEKPFDLVLSNDKFEPLYSIGQ